MILFIKCNYCGYQKEYFKAVDQLINNPENPAGFDVKVTCICRECWKKYKKYYGTLKPRY